MSLNQTERLLAAYKIFFADGVVGSYVNGAILPGEAEPIKLINPATGDVFCNIRMRGLM
jgi:aldehyde dehydrogenase (NAD+)